jgi:hypothetical protein
VTAAAGLAASALVPISKAVNALIAMDDFVRRRREINFMRGASCPSLDCGGLKQSRWY